MRIILRASAGLWLAILTATPALASPINISTLLTGDPRPGFPQDLAVRVTITGDTQSKTTQWTVDLQMWPEHPLATLNEFGFNLYGSSSLYSVNNLNLPYSKTTGTLDDSDNSQFRLTLSDPSGYWQDASNFYSLRFAVTKTSNFTLNDFLLAPASCSDKGSLVGCNQLGASLQTLGWHLPLQDGVAVGNYFPTSGSVPNPVPEPGSLLLLGGGAVAALLRHRRASHA